MSSLYEKMRGVMGTYFNPSNESYRMARQSDVYVDKTGLLMQLNRMMGTERRCIALSHARRFGKSQAAGMIDAYYSLGSDSHDLFADTQIAKASDYEKYLNKYNVIHLDIATFWDLHKENFVEEIYRSISDDIQEICGDEIKYNGDLVSLLIQIYKKTRIPFVIIIDEWDCVIRNSNDDELVHKYLRFLHSIFKSEESKKFLALGYITGILPIKKIQDESALNNFIEYTMLKSKPITQYFGFTEDEVRSLCDKYGMDFDTEKAWYNGYLIDGIHMYNPNSVVNSMMNQDYDSYWRNTSSFETLAQFISMNYDGLKDDVVAMMAGGMVEVEPRTFKNDLGVIHSKDDALTALIHLGYLGYDSEEGAAYIPNYEVASAFDLAVRDGNWNDISASISRCESLLKATIRGEAEKVAELIELAHDTYTSVLKYNDENSLSCVLTMAYFTAPAYYNIIRECPAGKGYADFIFIPRANAGNRPAFVVELKYNNSVDAAIAQIKDRRYQGALNDYKGKILLVGVSYDKDSENKKHECVIEEIL